MLKIHASPQHRASPQRLDSAAGENGR